MSKASTHTIRPTHRWIGALTFLLAATIVAGPASAVSDDLTAFAGSWVRDAAAADDAARVEAIERATAHMSAPKRLFARRIIRSNTRASDRMEIMRQLPALRVESEGRKNSRIELTSDFRDTPDGRMLDSIRETGVLERRFDRGDEGHGTVIWRLAPDGNSLRIEFTIHSGHFETPLRYTIRYRRAADDRTLQAHDESRGGGDNT